MKRYLYIFSHLFIFQIKHLMSYRLNGLLRFFHYPSFTLGSFVALYIAYQASPVIVGWTFPQAAVLFLTYHFVTASIYMLFFEGGVRRFLYWGVRTGEFDFVLTKPINPQFLAMFGRPTLDGLSSITVVIGLAIYLSSIHQLPPIDLRLVPVYAGFVTMGIVSFYLFCAGVSTLAFYVSSGSEVVELISKFDESGQRPLTIFPHYLQVLAITFIPIGLISYIPTSILLHKVSWAELVLSLSALPLTYIFNRYMWFKGMRHYSSASS